MDPISLEDLALLDVLKRIDQHLELTHGDTEIRQRLVDGGLIEDDEEGVRLTRAGIELCKSLQHRVAVDAQAEKVLKERAEAEAAAADQGSGIASQA